MAGQGINRREAMRMMAIAAAAAQAGGFARWVFAEEAAPAHRHGGQGPTAPKAGKKNAEYKPRFCTKAEYTILLSLSDLIIPTDGTPGANEAGCAEFTDFMISQDSPKQKDFRKGLQPFLRLNKEKQNERLEELSLKRDPFFMLLRGYTVMGYYTSRAGMEALGVPGLKTYPDSPECNHPEHLA